MPTRELRRTLASFSINIPEDASSDSSASPRDLSTIVSGTAPIVTVPASPTTDQDVSDEALYPRHGSLDRDTREIGQPGPLEYAGELKYPECPQVQLKTCYFNQRTRIHSPAGSMIRDTGDLEQLGCLESTGELGYSGFPSLTTDRLVQLQTHIYSPAGPGDTEQLEYRYRPITPGEEKIMRIYEDGIYCPPGGR